MKTKGVDNALTKDLLSNAFLDNYDVAVVITGDADYRPVIQEVERLGKTVCVMAFTDTSAKLYFKPITTIYEYVKGGRNKQPPSGGESQRPPTSSQK